MLQDFVGGAVDGGDWDGTKNEVILEISDEVVVVDALGWGKDGPGIWTDMWPCTG